MHIELKRNGSTTVIGIRSDRLDATNVSAMREEFARAITGVGGVVVIDLAEVAFIDSSGLALLVHLQKLVTPQGGSVHLTGVGSRDIATLLRITRLDQMFEVTDDVVVGVAPDRKRRVA
jgi:anti-sigma B factor antagonist